MSNDARLTAEQIKRSVEIQRDRVDADIGDVTLPVSLYIQLCDMALRSLSEGGEPVAWVDAREIAGLQSGLVICADLYPEKHKRADTALYAAPPQGEWVSVPREPTEEMWDAAWKSVGLPYRAKLSIHEIKTLFNKFHAAMLSAAAKDGGK